MLLGRKIGPDERENPVRLVGIGGPDLLAVDQIVITLVLALGHQRREIGAGIRLGIALRPADLATGDAGQMLKLLLMRAIFQECRAEHPDAEGLQRDARLQALHLIAQDLGVGLVEPATAILGRPFRNRPALVGHPVQPQFLRFGELEVPATPDDIVLALHRLTHFLGTIGFEPAPDFFSEGFQIGHDLPFIDFIEHSV